MTTAAQPYGYRTALNVASELAIGAPRKVMEVLNQSSLFYDMMPMVKANLKGRDGHMVEVRSALPESFMTSRGEGVTPSRGGTQLITYKIGQAENLQKEKLQVAEIGEGPEAYMTRQAPAHAESLRQMAQSQIIYGNPEDNLNYIKGLNPIYNALTGNLASNVIDCGGGSGTNTRAYFLHLGEDGFFLTYPDDGQAGIDAGKITLDWEKDATTGKEFQVLRRPWRMQFGAAVGNWFNLCAFVNIDMPSLRDGSSVLDLNEKLRKAPYRLQVENPKGVWIMNASLMEQLDSSMFRRLTSGGGLTDYQTVTGKAVKAFNGYPVMRFDQIINTEGNVA